VEDDAFFVTELPDFANGLEHPDFVVGGHNGDENRLVVHGALQVFKIDEPIGFHGQIRHAIAILLKALAGVEHGFVLGDLRDDVVSALAIHFGNALDSEVVALGSTGCENDSFGGGADEFGDLLAGGFNSLLRLPSKGVITAGGVAELGSEKTATSLQARAGRADWWRDYPCKWGSERPPALLHCWQLYSFCPQPR